ncbi:MAG TPA: hypothetical protein VII16_01060 [Actinomycetes bacterium]
MTTRSVAGRRLVGLLRTTDCGHWYLAVDASGALSGVLRFDTALVRNPAVTDRLTANVASVQALGLPGVLPVADLVAADDTVWLITVVAPGPTVAEFIDDGSARRLDAGSAATLLNETAQTLAALHAAGVVHGALGGSTVLIGPNGKAALAEVGLAVALEVRPGEAVHDARGWARLAAQLARAWAGDDVEGSALIGQAAATAEIEGLDEGRLRLVDGRAVLPSRFLDRTALISAKQAWSAHMANFVAASHGADLETTTAGQVAVGDATVLTDPPDSARSLLTAAAQSGLVIMPSVALAAQPPPVVQMRQEFAPPRAGDVGDGEAPAGYGPPTSYGASADYRVRPTTGVPGHGQRRRAAEAPRRKRRIPRVALVLGVLALLLAGAGVVYWIFRPPGELILSDVEVQPPVKPACNSTVDVIGVISTNGGAGTVRYRWVRNDGHASNVLAVKIPARRERTEVTLRWTFEGKGSFDAEATLEVLEPTAKSDKGSFTYACK